MRVLENRCERTKGCEIRRKGARECETNRGAGRPRLGSPRTCPNFLTPLPNRSAAYTRLILVRPALEQPRRTDRSPCKVQIQSINEIERNARSAHGAARHTFSMLRSAEYGRYAPTSKGGRHCVSVFFCASDKTMGQSPIRDPRASMSLICEIPIRLSSIY